MKNVKRIKYDLDNTLLFNYLIVYKQTDRLIAEELRKI